MKKKQNLYLIYNKNFRNWCERLDMLSTASKKFGINVVLVNSEEFDFSKWEDIPAIKTDMFYNVTPYSHEIENIFIHKGLTSFFIEPNKINHMFSTHQLDLSLINGGIPTPKTILKGTNDRHLLEKYVDYLDGFPLVLKVTGGTLGIGVIKIESWENLVSTSDMLFAKKIHFQLKEYIPNVGTVRVIVVGENEVCSIIRMNKENDFRCSAPNSNSTINTYSCTDSIKELAVKTAKAVNFEFVGIDLIEDEQGNPFVLEANYPNDFTIPANFTKINVGEAIVNFLYEKSNK